MQQLREGVQKDDRKLKKHELEIGPKPSYGYGGKFGVEKDRMDKVGYHRSVRVNREVSQ